MLQLQPSSPVFQVKAHKPVYTSEASSIGFPAGEWPTAFEWNGRVFNRGAASYGGDYTCAELLFYTYTALDGTEIKVWNA